MTNASDLDLFERWRTGDREAGNQLIERHFDSICRFFENKAPDAADELVQHTFLACARSLEQFRKKASFRTYLFTIARNELYRYWRSRRRDRHDLDFSVTSLADLGTTPSGRLVRRQEQKLLLQALAALPLEQQIILELRYWEDLNVTELADMFDIAAGSMRARLYRARNGLRERMNELADVAMPGVVSDADFADWTRGLRPEFKSS